MADDVKKKVSRPSYTWPPRLLHLFHKRWGSDHESPEYNKAEWQEMEVIIQKLLGNQVS